MMMQTSHLPHGVSLSKLRMARGVKEKINRCGQSILEISQGQLM